MVSAIYRAQTSHSLIMKIVNKKKKMKKMLKLELIHLGPRMNQIKM